LGERLDRTQEVGGSSPPSSIVMVEEAKLEETASGLKPVDKGWFVVNVRDARWGTHEAFGASCTFEGSWPDASFPQLGISLRVLQPGQPNCLYHRESQQEDFLVLAGECLLLVEGQERRLRAWDFVHCAPNTEHVFVGAGDGPSVIVMVGVRTDDEGLFYPVSELAGRYGASVETETGSGDEAYAAYPEREPVRPDSWRELPWSTA
jgi:uncharacterized cupin superfamily protein